MSDRKSFEKSVPTPTHWVGIGLPYRSACDAYGVWRYDLQPKVVLDPELKHCSTVADVPDSCWKDITQIPPTRCVRVVPSGPHKNCRVFLTDPRGLFHWGLLDDGSVAVFNDTDGPWVVATSLAEFLTRVRLENRIWHKCDSPQPRFTVAEQAYIFALK